MRKNNKKFKQIMIVITSTIFLVTTFSLLSSINLQAKVAEVGKMYLGTNAIEKGDLIVYGKNSNLWNVVDLPNGNITLFSKSIIGDEREYDSSSHGNWSSSAICQYLNNEFTTSFFTTNEEKAISSYGETEITGINNTPIAISQKIVLPSLEEVMDGGTWGLYNETRTTTPASWWWLRSPGYYDHDVATVYEYGHVKLGGGPTSAKAAVRPAFKLDNSCILFTSCINKNTATVSTDLEAISSVEYVHNLKRNKWVLTLLDETKGVTLNNVSEKNGSITIKYSDAKGKFLSLIAINEDVVTHYGKIATITPDSTEGSVTFKAPTGVAREQLRIFAEDGTSEDETNYASEPIKLEVGISKNK